MKEKVLCCKAQLIHVDWLHVLCSSAKHGTKFMKLLPKLAQTGTCLGYDTYGFIGFIGLTWRDMRWHFLLQKLQVFMISTSYKNTFFHS